jgi:hypothetical protein
MLYRVEEERIFRKNLFGVIEYYQIVSGYLEFISPHEIVYTHKYCAYVIIVCLLKTDYEFTTLEPCMNSSKSNYEYKHYKLKKAENYNNFIYDGEICFMDFLIDDWKEIINSEDLYNKFKKTAFRYKLILDNNLFLKPIISEKVSHTYYDTIENKNKTIKIK